MRSEEILVVDDDNRVIKSLKVALKEYRIHDFNHGRDALAFLGNANTINVALVDVMMPGMDGLTVLKEIKKVNADIGVIMMTAFGTKDVIIESLRLHADDFVEKPFEIEILKTKIRSILRERGGDMRHDEGISVHLNRIKNFIRCNPKKASLNLIGKEMGLSPKYISRIFSRNNALSFREYKMKIKMDKARQLLARSRMSVNDIAARLGYMNGESFMRLFKQAHQMTPTEYREKHGRYGR